jgi:hypothetical protein
MAESKIEIGLFFPICGWLTSKALFTANPMVPESWRKNKNIFVDTAKNRRKNRSGDGEIDGEKRGEEFVTIGHMSRIEER